MGERDLARRYAKIEADACKFESAYNTSLDTRIAMGENLIVELDELIKEEGESDPLLKIVFKDRISEIEVSISSLKLLGDVIGE